MVSGVALCEGSLSQQRREGDSRKTPANRSVKALADQKAAPEAR
jgi:hypothetical protein